MPTAATKTKAAPTKSPTRKQTPSKKKAADFAVVFTVQPARLSQLIANVLPSASKDMARPLLAAVLLRLQGHRIVATTTDSYSISEDSLQVEAGAPPKGSAWRCVLSLTEIRRVTSFLKSSETTLVTARLSEGTLSLSDGPASLIVRTIEETDDYSYPDTDKLFEDSLAKFDKVPKRADFVLGLNATFVYRFAKILNAKGEGIYSTEFRIGNPHHPVSIKCGETFRALLMPVRLTNASPSPEPAKAKKATKAKPTRKGAAK